MPKPNGRDVVGYLPTPDPDTIRKLLALLHAEPAYTIAEAAALKGVSPDYVRRAIHRTEAPFLRAKKVGKSYRIAASALEEWWASLPDA